MARSGAHKDKTPSPLIESHRVEGTCERAATAPCSDGIIEAGPAVVARETACIRERGARESRTSAQRRAA
jgi:hypothetical protein